VGNARSAARQALDLAELEDDFQAWVIELAKRLGWRVHHTRAARTKNGWRTPVAGHKGFPDLLLCRRGVVIAAELKSSTGRLTADQRRWHEELGSVGRVWRPADRDAIVAELR
jgi:hypothetical protein